MTREERRRQFMLAARGLTAWQTSQIMRRIGTPGIDWSGSSKGRVADAYADKQVYGTTVREGVIEALQAAERKAKS